MQARPRPIARFGRRENIGARRTGSSISMWVSWVGIQEAATAASPAATERRGPQIAAAKTIAGQCQRYQE